MTTRNEKVRLSLEDAGFSTGMAKAAGQAALLERALDDLDGTQVDVGTSAKQTSREVGGLGETVKKAAPQWEVYGESVKQATLEVAIGEERARRLSNALRDQARAAVDAEQGIRNLDTSFGSANRSGHALIKSALALGPALVPIGAVGVAGVAGLANQLGFAAMAAGTAVLAFQGVGTALEAVSKAALEPTVENINAAQQAMRDLSPVAQELVRQIDSMRPMFEGFTDTAAAGMFPGLIAGLQDLEKIGPQVERVITSISRGLGDMFAAAGEDLASGRWDDFFKMLARQGRTTLVDLGSAIGSVTHGLSELWEAFAPLNRSTGSWLADAAKGFDDWATGLKKTEGFKEFVDYVHTNGPKVADAVGAIANALVQIGQAAAPVAGPVLDALTALADVIAMIADSPLGTPIMAGVTALSAYTLGANLATAATLRLKAAQASLGVGGAAGAAGVAGDKSKGGMLGSAASMIAVVLGVQQVIDKVDEGRSAFAQLKADFESGTTSVDHFTDAMSAVAHTIPGLGPVFDTARSGAEGLADALGLMPEIPVDDFIRLMGSTARKTAGDLGYMSEEEQRAAEKADRLKLAQQEMSARLRETSAAARETAAGFTNLGSAFEKPTLSLDNLMTRMARYAEANKNYAENLQKALENGADPRALQKMIDELGPAAGLALEQLANGGKAAARELNGSFGVMRRASILLKNALEDVGNTRVAATLDAKDLATLKVAAVQRLMNHYGMTKASAQALLKDLASGKVKTVQQLVNKYGMSKAEAQALLKDEAKGKLEQIIGLMNSVDGRHTKSSHTHTNTIITKYIGERGDQGLGPDRLGIGVATGGHIRGPGTSTSDSIPAWLSDGEYVIRAAAVAKYGAETFHALNAMKLASGGLVGEDHYWVPGDRNGVNSPHNGLGGDGDYDGPYNLTPDPHGGFGIDGLRKQLGLMRDEVRDASKALRGMNREVRQSERAMNKQERVLDKATEAYEKQVNVVEQVQQNFDALAENVSGRLTSGIFSGLENQPESSSPWAAPVQTDIFGSIMGTLGADTNAGRAWDKARDAIDDFIEGPALQALLEQATPDQLTSLAGLSGGQLDQIETAINLRDSVVGQAGAGSADAIFGAELRTQTALMSQSHAAQLEELAEFKAYREDWKAAVKREREADREKAILERQLQMLERELERARAERKGARDGKG